jgi:hypothetical protein
MSWEARRVGKAKSLSVRRPAEAPSERLVFYPDLLWEGKGTSLFDAVLFSKNIS